ncbi:hypothetical protein LJK88_44005 [Paenibacillus sp. P26]|nr:hypothetical protein LJK88_44005 [Paenibacillus sp. P26]
MTLVERAGRDGEADVSDGVVDHIAAPEDPRLVAEDHIRPLAVDILADAAYTGDGFADQAHELIRMRDGRPVRHEHDHDLARVEAVPRDDVAEQACVRFLAVRADAELPRHALDGGYDGVVVLLLDEALVHVDDAVAPLGIEAGDEAAFQIDANGHLRLVAVAPRPAHAERRQHFNSCFRLSLTRTDIT